jgi:hypothetical protein
MNPARTNRKNARNPSTGQHVSPQEAQTWCFLARFHVLLVKVIVRAHAATRVARHDVQLVRYDPWCPNRDAEYRKNSVGIMWG